MGAGDSPPGAMERFRWASERIGAGDVGDGGHAVMPIGRPVRWLRSRPRNRACRLSVASVSGFVRKRMSAMGTSRARGRRVVASGVSAGWDDLQAVPQVPSGLSQEAQNCPPRSSRNSARRRATFPSRMRPQQADQSSWQIQPCSRGLPECRRIAERAGTSFCVPDECAVLGILAVARKNPRRHRPERGVVAAVGDQLAHPMRPFPGGVKRSVASRWFGGLIGARVDEHVAAAAYVGPSIAQNRGAVWAWKRWRGDRILQRHQVSCELFARRTGMIAVRDDLDVSEDAVSMRAAQIAGSRSLECFEECGTRTRTLHDWRRQRRAAESILLIHGRRGIGRRAGQRPHGVAWQDMTGRRGVLTTCPSRCALPRRPRRPPERHHARNNSRGCADNAPLNWTCAERSSICSRSLSNRSNIGSSSRARRSGLPPTSVAIRRMSSAVCRMTCTRRRSVATIDLVSTGTRLEPAANALPTSLGTTRERCAG